MVRKTKLRLSIISLVLLAGLLLLPTVLVGCGSSNKTQSAETQAAGLRTDMRRLWSDHGWYTRETVVAILLIPGNVTAASTRLLNNQDDIGNEFAKYFGQDMGAQLATDLRQHILIAADLVSAAKVNDQAKMTDADNRWHSNGQDIAKLLSDNNSEWAYQDLLDMWNKHLDLVKGFTVPLLSNDFQGSVNATDPYINELMQMADTFTDGIITKFPDQFKQ